MRRSAPLVCSLIVALGLLIVSPRPGAPAASPNRWDHLDDAAREAVAAKHVPGVVFVVGQGDRILYRKAHGQRSVRPVAEPMTVDTVFDLASLTKPIATASAVLALVEDGRLRLSDPVIRWWPEFAPAGQERVEEKRKITVRDLLTHTSGMPVYVNFQSRFGSPDGPAVQDHTEKVLAAIAELPVRSAAGERFAYSDLGFITLGEIVRRASGKRLDEYAEQRIFAPLQMRNTGFNPPEKLRPRTAPTTLRRGEFLRGQVHDGNAAVSNGIAGHAGLFSTADDLTRFARMLLSSDRADRRRYPLGPATVRLMTTPQTGPGLPVRGLGWDIDSPYSHVRGDLMPHGSFGHTGFTGTYLWVDPYSLTYLIGLSNRVHPDGQGNPQRLWARAANIVAGTVRPGQLPPRERLGMP